ncbi:hypothetical protein C8R46DRAFT_1096544 [Mycena filopes]|nr:hypothetical protein C8R46DRAFT_1096544 [Mycena filopes]
MTSLALSLGFVLAAGNSDLCAAAPVVLRRTLPLTSTTLHNATPVATTTPPSSDQTAVVFLLVFLLVLYIFNLARIIWHPYEWRFDRGRAFAWFKIIIRAVAKLIQRLPRPAFPSSPRPSTAPRSRRSSYLTPLWRPLSSSASSAGGTARRVDDFPAPPIAIPLIALSAVYQPSGPLSSDVVSTLAVVPPTRNTHEPQNQLAAYALPDGATTQASPAQTVNASRLSRAPSDAAARVECGNRSSAVSSVVSDRPPRSSSPLPQVSTNRHEAHDSEAQHHLAAPPALSDPATTVIQASLHTVNTSRRSSLAPSDAGAQLERGGRSSATSTMGSNLVLRSSSPLPQASSSRHDAHELEPQHHTAPPALVPDSASTIHTLSAASQPSPAQSDTGAQVEQGSRWSPTSTVGSSLGSRSSSPLPQVSTDGHHAHEVRHPRVALPPSPGSTSEAVHTPSADQSFQWYDAGAHIELVTSWSSSSLTVGSDRPLRSSPPPPVSAMRRLLRPFTTS